MMEWLTDIIEWFSCFAEFYLIYWRIPVAELLQPVLPFYFGLVPEIVFYWTSTFIAANGALLFGNGETMWGHFEGPNEPIRALIVIAVCFLFFPLFIFSGLASSRWESQDLGASLLMAWLMLMSFLGAVANIIF